MLASHGGRRQRRSLTLQFFCVAADLAQSIVGPRGTTSTAEKGNAIIALGSRCWKTLRPRTLLLQAVLQAEGLWTLV